MHVVRRFRYGIDGETEAVAGDSVCHIAPCQLRCDQSIAQQQIARCMMPSGETVGAVSGSAKFWSEWQDLNLRPPRPERGPLPLSLCRIEVGRVVQARTLRELLAISVPFPCHLSGRLA